MVKTVGTLISDDILKNFFLLSDDNKVKEKIKNLDINRIISNQSQNPSTETRENILKMAQFTIKFQTTEPTEDDVSNKIYY